MEIIPFREEFLPEAAALFAGNYRWLRQTVPALPARLAHPEHLTELMKSLLVAQPALAAVHQGQLVGYLGWYLVDHFRDTRRRAAYCPEWGHGALAAVAPVVYRALYQAATVEWQAARCQAHAVTLLANDPLLEKFWFWNGFGLMVVDSVRAVRPLDLPPRRDLCLRKASLPDIQLLCEMDAEHWAHYSQPPMLMAPQEPRQADEFEAILQDAVSSVWLAFDLAGGIESPMGFISFAGHDFGSADILEADGTLAVSGAYLRPEFRGRGAATALLDAALQEYAARGLQRCCVDFESFNPLAAALWLKYFEPVCYSVIRIPEYTG